MQRQKRTWSMVVVFLMSLLTVAWRVHPVYAQTPGDARGLVISMPDGGKIGQWVIGDGSYNADSNTEFDETEGALAVGACAKVAFVTGADGALAVEIDSEPADDCSGATEPGDDNGGAVEPQPGDDNGDAVEPQPGDDNGGAVEPQPGDDNGGAVEPQPGDDNGGAVEPQPGDDNGGAVEAQPVSENSGGHGGDRIEFYGLIEQMPATGLTGNWVVSGTTYTVDAQTEFEQEHGGFNVGVCVKVKSESETPTLAEEISSEEAYKCNGQSDGNHAGEHEFEGKLFGVVDSFPAALVGDWQISGMPFVATDATEFDQHEGSFAVNTTVKVEFTENMSGTRIMRSVETVFANDDDGQDDDGNGSVDGAEGHAFGLLESVPVTGVGVYVVGGVQYTATASTELDSGLVVGAMVKVEYHLDANGSRIAEQIETMSAEQANGIVAEGELKLVGYVQAMPATGLVGDWKIGGESFVADLTTLFDESNGLPAVGSYVEVEYNVSNNVRTIVKMETQVPPGAGAEDNLGTLESVGDDGLAGASSLSAAAGQVWRINGVAYTVTAATDLSTAKGGLSVGSKVMVNAYTAIDGSRVATRVQGMDGFSFIFLPVLQR